MGADIECASDGCPPLHIRANALRGGEVYLKPQASSQFVSALLLTAPLCQQDVTLCLDSMPVSQPYIDLTLAYMQKFGVTVTVKQHSPPHYFIAAPQEYKSPAHIDVEGDATAATYFLGAAALPGCGPVQVTTLGFDSSQGDLQFTQLLAQMGAEVCVAKNTIEVRGPDIAKQPRLKALNEVNMNSMPDAAMTLAVLALFADGATHIRDVANLRLKESERLRGVKTELEKLGATVREDSASLHITPPERIQTTCIIECYADHRMAMAFSLAAYGAEIQIADPQCVSKTYRNFFTDFLPLCH